MSSSHLFRKEDIAGKTVIDSSGLTTGKVRDVVFSLDGEVILVVEKKDGAEIQVPLNRVAGLSEFVVTKSESFAQPRTLAGNWSGGGGSCRFCGHELSSTSSYCPSCGKSQR